jgi:8-oxo-dGTP diphosphatase
MREQLVARAFVLDRNKKVFLCERASEPGKGKMEMPGGKVDRGETPQRAVVRELREETGLIFTPSSKKPIGIDRDEDSERNVVWITHYFHGTVSGKRNLDPTEVALAGHFSREQIEESSFEMPFNQKDQVMKLFDWYEDEGTGLTLPRKPFEDPR